MQAFKDWQQTILHRQGLHAPDGRPLYRYRLTDEEFASLEALLKESLGKYLRFADLGTIAGNIVGFPALFVLYAAEWWRRRYDGSGWSWEPILRDLGVGEANWSESQRSECVKQGLQRWALKLRETGGLRYLGTVALQGGLPMRLLAEAQGNLGRVLSQVLRQSQNGSVGFQDIVTWVESMNRYLPKTYRQSEIHVLLAEVVWTVLKLKNETGLVQSAEAVARLDRNVPDWRERFPLPISDTHAQGLLEQLIRDVAATRPERRTALLPAERWLELTRNGGWTLSSSVELPDKLTSDQLAKLFSADHLNSRTLELCLDLGGERRSVGLRRLIGHDAYRVNRRPWRLEGELAADRHAVYLLAPSGQQWTAQLPKGEALDPDLPWVFGPEEQERFPFLSQGSGSVVATDALIAIPEGWSIATEADSPAELQGMLELPARRLYRIRGSVRISDASGQTYRVRTGKIDTKEEHYEWRGEAVWEDFLSPGMAFRNIPRLYLVDEDGYRRPAPGQLGWRPIGGDQATPGGPIGPLSVWYSAGGEIKHRARMVILPSEARVELSPSDGDSGLIRLAGWKACNANVITPGVDAGCAIEDQDLAVTVSIRNTTRPPEWVEMELRWPHAPVPAKVRFPFPITGARTFDAQGRALAPGELVAAHQLSGIRLLALAGDPENLPQIRLVLKPDGIQRPRMYRLCPSQGSSRVEIRLQDYAADIQHLLAMDDGPDSRVTVDLRIGDEVFTCLRIARYSCNLLRLGDCIGLDREGLSQLEAGAVAKLPVLAMRLEAPGEEPMQLQGLVSEGVATGMWNFAPATRDPGAWLIYPGPDSDVVFRPTLWKVPGEIPTDSPLSRALSVADQAERSVAIDDVIRALAADFTHPCWTEVEQLASQLGHLHLSTLDLWRRFAQSAAGMAALTLRLGSLSNDFVHRFAQDLPFAWETVSFSVWRQAMGNLRRQCIQWYGDKADPGIFSSHLKSRVGEMEAEHAVLSKILGIARAAVTDDGSKDVRALCNLGVEGIGARLFEGNDCPLQQLLRTHAENGIGGDRWPTDFRDWIDDYRSRNGRLLHSGCCDFQDSVINLPILLAIQAATDTTGDWFENPQRIHALRVHQNFNPDWFIEAYDWTIARCLAAGLLIGRKEL